MSYNLEAAKIFEPFHQYLQSPFCVLSEPYHLEVKLSLIIEHTMDTDSPFKVCGSLKQDYLYWWFITSHLIPYNTEADIFFKQYEPKKFTFDLEMLLV